MIGSFGPVIFTVSDWQIRTFRDFSCKKKADFAEHAVIEGKPRLQHIGTGLNEISFTMQLTEAFGISVSEELQVLETMLVGGRDWLLILGTKVLGAYVLVGIDEKWQTIDNRGRLLRSTVTLSLKENGQ